MADAAGLTLGAAARGMLLANPFRYGFSNSLVNLSGFVFDIIMSESREQSATVTEHAIQDGSTITDHIHFALANGTLGGKVSNHSKFAPPTTPFAADRFKTAYEEAERIYLAGEPVTAYCVMRKYENVIIDSLSMDRDGDSGLAQEFTMTFKQLRIVDPIKGVIRAQTVPVNMGNSDNRQGSPVLNLGAS